MKFILLFSIFLAVSCSHLYSSVNKIAISVQGRADKLLQWITAFNTIDHTKKILLHDLNTHAVLFLISNDKPLPVDKCNNIPGVSCLFMSGANWVEMRNKQAHAIYSYEVLHATEVKYWLFAEDEMMPMTCSSHLHEIQPQQSINCFSRFIRFLLSRSSYAVIMGTPNMAKVENLVNDVFCGDHMFVAYHRHAVHILFPYVEYQSRDKSIADSRGVANMLMNRCLNGYSVSSGMLGFPSAKERFRNQTFHPDSTSPSRRLKAITSVYSNLNIDYLTYYKEPYREMCFKPKSASYVNLERGNVTSNWKVSSPYHICSKALRHYFHTFASHGRVVIVSD